MNSSAIAQKLDAKSAKSSGKKSLPTVFIVTNQISDEIIKKHVKPLVSGLAHLDVQVLDEDYQDMHKAINDCDIVIMLNENEEILKYAWSQGVVPVTQSFLPSIQDYNPNTESGNAFIYKNVDKWEIFAATVRALETNKFPYDWKFIKRSCIKSA